MSSGGRQLGRNHESSHANAVCPGEPARATPCSPVPDVGGHNLLDLFAQVPNPRRERGRRCAGRATLGRTVPVIALARSFVAIGQRVAHADPEALAALGAARDPAEEPSSGVPLPWSAWR